VSDADLREAAFKLVDTIPGTKRGSGTNSDEAVEVLLAECLFDRPA
jgi:hypothetical protein